jgi:hypothetical protein
MVLFGFVMNTDLHLLTLILLAHSLKDLFLLELQQQAELLEQVRIVHLQQKVNFTSFF